MAVIVGSGQGSEKKKRLLLILGGVMLLILAGAAGVGLRMLQNKDNESPAITTKGSGFTSTIDDIQSLRAKGDLEGANARAEQALSDPNLPSKERYDLYIQQGNNAVDKQDYIAAITAYEKAEALDATYTVALTLARTWEMAGDKAKALTYYKKALPLVPASPVQKEDKASVQAKIDELEGQP